jgi:hypothetical protein
MVTIGLPGPADGLGEALTPRRAVQTVKIDPYPGLTGAPIGLERTKLCAIIQEISARPRNSLRR